MDSDKEDGDEIDKKENSEKNNSEGNFFYSCWVDIVLGILTDIVDELFNL